MDDNKTTQKKRKPLVTVLLILLALVLIAALAVFLYANSKLNKIQYEAPSVAATPVPTIDVAAAAEEGIVLPQGEVIEEEKIVNILFLGTDLRLPNTSDPGRADSTMLCSLNMQTGAVKLISFERGIFVPIPGREADLLTHAYHWGGAELSQSIIEQCFLVDLTGYAQVDFDTFAEVIDAIGGVDIELTDVEAMALNGNYWTTNARTENEMQEGVNHLNGYDTLQYCRLRFPDDDWHRQQRQRNTIAAALKQLRTLNLTELDKVADTVLPLIHTNLSKQEITNLLLNATKFLNASVEQLQVPDKNMSNGYIACDFTYESRKISNFIYGTDYELVSPY